jgi:hypothetical protein
VERRRDEAGGALVQKNRDPVRPGRIRGTARVASADCKLLDARIAQQAHRALWQDFRAALRVSDNSPIVVGGREQARIRPVLFRQRARRLIKIRRRQLDEFRQPCLLTYRSDGPAH